MVTWGTSPDQSVPVGGTIPDADGDVLDFMGFTAGAPIMGTHIDVAFMGSCTNGRLLRLRGGRRLSARARPARRTACQGASRARLPPGARCAGATRPGPGLPRRRFPVPRRRLLALLRYERRSAGRPRSLRVIVEPQLPWTPGIADRPHIADVAGMVAAAAITGEVTDARHFFGAAK